MPRRTSLYLSSPYWRLLQILLKVPGTPRAGIEASKGRHEALHVQLVFSGWSIWIPGSLGKHT
jgi:hypothetical protein